MSGWTSWLVGKRENPNAAREAIIGLRQQLLMLDKKEEHLNKKIDDETRKAKAAVTTNKRGKCGVVRWQCSRRAQRV
jgi:charged multivesicular body protein 4